MDERQIQIHLDAIAKQEIPDDMNLWNDIQAQLEPRNKPKLRHAMRVTWVTAAILVLMVSAVAYGFYQQGILGDAGLDAANRANLITYFNETQTIEKPYKIDVTLDYAYADANRITIAYSYTASIPAKDVGSVFSNPTLSDDQNGVYPFLPLGGGGGGGGGSSDPNELIVVSSGMTANFDATLLTEPISDLNLHLLVEVAQTQPNGDPNRMVLLGSVNFDFTIPFNAGLVMTTPQTVTVGDLPITLQKAVVTPSLTRLEMCYTDPDPVDQLWTPVATLKVEGKVIFEHMGILLQAGLGGTLPSEDPNTCRALLLPEGLQEYVGKWELTITDLRLPNSEDMNIVAQRLKDEYGFEITVVPGENGYGYDTKPGIEDALSRLILEEEDQIAGPWVFTFTLPE